MVRSALSSGQTHRLYGEVAPLGEALLDAAASLAALPECPVRVAHGDLKINNLMFAGSDASGRVSPRALIDLDTVAPMPLAHELGDAWRSWCNRASENEPEARFDLDHRRRPKVGPSKLFLPGPAQRNRPTRGLS